MEKKSKQIALIGAIALIGVYTMNSTSFKHYGVPPIGRSILIDTIIQYVCFILGNGSNDNADLLLKETITTETGYATIEDRSTAYGEGLGQFDKIAFTDVKYRTSQAKKEKIKKYFLIDIDTAEYEDLRHNPLLSVIFIRLKYLLVPTPIPVDLQERYQYYKIHYNSKYGKATLDHFLKMNNYELV